MNNKSTKKAKSITWVSRDQLSRHKLFKKLTNWDFIPKPRNCRTLTPTPHPSQFSTPKTLTHPLSLSKMQRTLTTYRPLDDTYVINVRQQQQLQGRQSPMRRMDDIGDLPIYDPRSTVGRRSRPWPEKWIHVIPITILLVFFILWWSSYPGILLKLSPFSFFLLFYLFGCRGKFEVLYIYIYIYFYCCFGFQET